MLTLKNPDAVRSLYENLGIKLEDSRDEYGTDLGFQIEVTFDWFAENEFSSDAAFEKFKAFREEHDFLFDDELKQLIWKTAEKIGRIFAGHKKADVLILSKLRMILGLPLLSATGMIEDCGVSIPDKLTTR